MNDPERNESEWTHDEKEMGDLNLTKVIEIGEG